ncbi:carboxypeptidase Taq M32 metallopeptidase domain protein, partial [Leptospira interrogans serovar Icterohaemorrhagiae str. Verdun HP]
TFSNFFKTKSKFSNNSKRKKDFSSLLNWLRQNVHWKGKFYSVEELIRLATNTDPDSSYLVQYLENKIIELESI